jgi:hypothetical protein
MLIDGWDFAFSEALAELNIGTMYDQVTGVLYGCRATVVGL